MPPFSLVFSKRSRSGFHFDGDRNAQSGRHPVDQNLDRATNIRHARTTDSNDASAFDRSKQPVRRVLDQHVRSRAQIYKDLFLKIRVLILLVATYHGFSSARPVDERWKRQDRLPDFRACARSRAA